MNNILFSWRDRAGGGEVGEEGLLFLNAQGDGDQSSKGGDHL